jgi:hypothetical protein
MLKRLLRTGLVEPVRLYARPPLALENPLAIINPGDQEPDYDAIEWMAEKRIEEPREYVAYRATQRAANIYGGTVAQLQPLQAGHDIQISSVLEAHRRRGVNVTNWAGEDRLGSLKKLLPKLPDALVMGAPIIVVEVIGRYPASRVREFVRAFNGLQWTVELW